MSNSLRPHGLQPTRLLHPWDFPGKSVGVSCHCLIQEENGKLLKHNIQKNEDHGIWSHHFVANRWGNNGNNDRLFFPLGSKITADGDCSHEIKRRLLLGRKAMTNLDSILKSRDITLLTKVHIIKAMVFPVVMQGCESWTIKKAEHWRIDAFELWCWRRVERLLDNKEMKTVHPKGNQSWIFIARTDAEAEAEAVILQSPDAKNWLIGKDPDAGKDWRQEEKGTTEDDMVGRHHRLDGHEFEQVRGLVMDREVWHVAVHGVAKSWTRLSNWTELNL